MLNVREILEQGRTDRTAGSRENIPAFLYRSTRHVRKDKASPSDQRSRTFPYRAWLSWLPLETMGSQRHFHQASFPPFLDTHSSSIHPLGMSVPDDSRSQDCISYSCSSMLAQDLSPVWDMPVLPWGGRAGMGT